MYIAFVFVTLFCEPAVLQDGGSGRTRPQQNNQYHLNIRKTELTDAGTYQCQNSEVDISIYYNLLGKLHVAAIF